MMPRESVSAEIKHRVCMVTWREGEADWGHSPKEADSFAAAWELGHLLESGWRVASVHPNNAGGAMSWLVVLEKRAAD